MNTRIFFFVLSILLVFVVAKPLLGVDRWLAAGVFTLGFLTNVLLHRFVTLFRGATMFEVQVGGFYVQFIHLPGFKLRERFRYGRDSNR